MAQAAAAGGLPTSDRAHKSIAVPVSGTALLLIDVINDLAFNGSDALVAQADDQSGGSNIFGRQRRHRRIPS